MVIYTPNCKEPNEKGRPRSRLRKERPDQSDLERYADIVTAYRELLKLSALEDDINLHAQRVIVPHDRAQLLEWVAEPKNLDLVAAAFRRACSGYVSTGRLFAVQSGPICTDWAAVSDSLEAAERSLRTAYTFLSMGKERKALAEVGRIKEALEILEEVRASDSLSEFLASRSELMEGVY